MKHLLKKNKQTKQSIIQVTVVGSIANIALSAVKVTTGYLAGSQALVADGIHSLSDLVTDATILVGAPYWTAPPDDRHPFGHGRVETLVNIFIGLILLVTAVGIGWKSIITIGEKHTAAMQVPTLFAASLSILVKELLYHWTAIKGRAVGSSAMVANAWHHRSDAISSIPVVVAVIVNWIFPQLTYLDHIAALLVSVMLLKVAYDIASPSLKEIMETRTETDLEKKITAMAAEFSNIREIHKVRCRHIGGSVFVDLHMLVDANLTVGAAHQIADDLTDHIKATIPKVIETLVHIEPFEDEQL